MPEARVPSYQILAVEESASSLAFYNPETAEEIGRVALSLWPHEISVSSDGHAYVSNFGVRDYDLSLGYAGNSVSVIDIRARAEKGRFFTRDGDQKYWAPHGVKVSPDEQYVYVNVERVLGVRTPDLDRPGSEFTKLLKFERGSGQVVRTLAIPLAAYNLLEPNSDRVISAYDVIPGTHNFVFSPHDPDELWLFSGRAGVSVFNVGSGAITHRLQSFNGAVRSLSFGRSGRLLVSATNEVSLVDPRTKDVLSVFGDLGVGQILYSTLTPDERHILAPAVWEGQVLVISTDNGSVVHRITTGIDPVQIVVSPDDRRAYVTHGRTQWLSYIDLDDLSRVGGRIPTRGGPNGIAFAPWSGPSSRKTVRLAACLPFTGAFSAEGRELRLGYQHWQDRVNASGGLVIGGEPFVLEIEYTDTRSSLDPAELGDAFKQLVERTSPDALLGSFPSWADGVLGQYAVKAGLPFVSGLGMDEELFSDPGGLAFSLAPMSRCRLEPVLLAVKQRLSPVPQRVAVLACDRKDLLREAEVTRDVAKSLGFTVCDRTTEEIVKFELGGSDLPEKLKLIQDAVPDLLLVITDPVDAIRILHLMGDMNFRPGGVASSTDLTNLATVEKMGRHAVGVMSGVPWVPTLVEFAEDRFGSGDDFARGYFNEFSENASGIAAAAAAVGILLEGALQQCTAVADLPSKLASQTLDTFYSPVKFASNGRNLAHPPAAIQINEPTALRKWDVLWPLALAGANRPRWPY